MPRFGIKIRYNIYRAQYKIVSRSVPELTLIATIPVGDAPGWAETADAGRLCLIANSRSDDLSISSIPERTEVTDARPQFFQMAP